LNKRPGHEPDRSLRSFAPTPSSRTGAKRSSQNYSVYYASAINSKRSHRAEQERQKRKLAVSSSCVTLDQFLIQRELRVLRTLRASYQSAKRSLKVREKNYTVKEPATYQNCGIFLVFQVRLASFQRVSSLSIVYALSPRP
jgi:hypothetical protein